MKAEKEKMLAGEPYNTRDAELLDRYHFARDLLKEYNSLYSREIPQREEILLELLGKTSKGVWIEAPFWCDYGENIRIGENTFVNGCCFFIDDNLITIGKNCLIGPSVQVYTAKHPLAANQRVVPASKQTKDQAAYITQTAPVTIGDNVWVGGNTVILPGVTIGSNTTIGAGSVVTKDIPDGVLAYGNPCRIIREISDSE